MYTWSHSLRQAIFSHCRPNDLPHTLYITEDSDFDFRSVRLCDYDIPREKVLNYLQIVETLIRRPHCAASDLELHCLPNTFLWVSRLQWVILFLFTSQSVCCEYSLEAPLREGLHLQHICPILNSHVLTLFYKIDFNKIWTNTYYGSPT